MSKEITKEEVQELESAIENLMDQVRESGYTVKVKKAIEINNAVGYSVVIEKA